MPNKMDLTGQRFGRLTVLRFHSIENKRTFFLCKCDCGNEKKARADGLRSGVILSCGCYNKEVNRKHPNHLKHGKINTRLYGIWCGMKGRCNNKNFPAYNRYGGKGVKVCDEWINDFQTFYNWAMANGYADNLSIDRIDNNGNYEPSNCRWATAKEQNQNKSNVTVVEIDGQKKSLTEWARYAGIAYSTISKRFKHGITGKALIEKGKNDPWMYRRKSQSVQ